MIIDFLRKIRSELLEEKMKLQEIQNEAQMKLDEKTILIRKLKVEEEKSFDAFSPRKQNVELRETICHLEEEKQEIMVFCEKMKDKLQYLNSRLEELNSILEVAKQQKIEIAKLLAEQSKHSDLEIMEDFNADFYEQLMDLKRKAEFCLKLLDIDPVRCKFELSSMVKEFKIMIKMFQERSE